MTKQNKTSKMRKCIKCKKTLPVDLFWKETRQTHKNNVCSTCRNKIRRKRYARNKDRDKKRKANVIKRNSVVAYQWLEISQCEKCGEKNAVILNYQVSMKDFGDVLRNKSRKNMLNFVKRLHILCVRCEYVKKIKRTWKINALKELL